MISSENSGLVWLFNGISTLFRLINTKAILLEEQQWHYITHSWEDKGFHTFPKGICPKVNVIARLEYELAYYNSAVHRFKPYTTYIFIYIYAYRLPECSIHKKSFAFTRMSSPAIPHSSAQPTGDGTYI